jgi:protein SDA1
MGHTKEAHSLPFGHDAKAAEDIDGLVVSCDVQKFTHLLSTRPPQLLEDHLKSLPAENFEAGDEQAWDNWLVESDSEPSSDESDWINVESDGSNNLEVSDSDSEMADGESGFARSNRHEQSSARVSSLATTKVRNAPHPTRSSGLHPS